MIQKLISSGAMIMYSAVALCEHIPLVSVEESWQEKRKGIWCWKSGM